MPPSTGRDTRGEEKASGSGQGKAKGTLVVGVVKALRWFKEKGRAATPPHLHPLLDTRVLPSTWYDEADYLELLHVLASITEPPAGIEVWEYLGRQQGVASFFERSYQNLLREGDPQWTLANFPLLWKLRHDTGAATVVTTGNDRARVDLADFSIVSRDYCRAIGGTIWALLDRCGAKEIRVLKVSCRAEGKPICTWDASWTPTTASAPLAAG